MVLLDCGTKVLLIQHKKKVETMSFFYVWSGNFHCVYITGCNVCNRVVLVNNIVQVRRQRPRLRLRNPEIAFIYNLSAIANGYNTYAFVHSIDTKLHSLWKIPAKFSLDYSVHLCTSRMCTVWRSRRTRVIYTSGRKSKLNWQWAGHIKPITDEEREFLSGDQIFANLV